MSEYTDARIGQIRIADEVIAIIAGTAAAEVEGIVLVSGTPTDSIAGLFGKKNLAKGVKVSVQDGEASIEIELAVRFGTLLREVAEEVQNKIKNAVETMTGLSVAVVDVNISAVVVEKTNSKEENEAQ
ncbi:MAG TPA: Asp23/Gls24 family envelope stress response protein [Lachnospiraceae bacterium]|jgi:Uncharacterized protein conserved in bacteria|nr:Asp23/Gls24 family envelope stress response protein [Lachnospiraceae bacterium]